MIRKVLLSTVAFVAISGTAFAADLPSRRAPPVYVPPPIPIFSWTGFYIGGDIGVAFGRDKAFATATAGRATASAGPINIGQHNGVIGGGHIGYNLSTQSFPLLAGFGGAGGVIGVEADFTGSDYRGSLGANANLNPIVHTTSDVQGSVRGRLGIAADRALFFVTGGAAVAEFKNSYEFDPFVPYTSLSHDRIGYTVGGGVEYALTTNWSLRAEYRYSDFGTFRDQLYIPVGNRAIGISIAHQNIMQRATLGFSYKFDTPMAAPVVARY